MKSLLLVIDFINDIVHPDGKIASCAEMVSSNQTIKKANCLSEKARSAGVLVVQVKVGFSPSYIECPARSPMFSKAKEFKALMLGSWGADFHDDLVVDQKDHVLVKHRVSALYGTDLETILRANKVERVFLSGVSTNMAVETTARELHDRDYEVIVVKDACASANEIAHEGSLKNLERLALLLNVDECNF